MPHVGDDGLVTTMHIADPGWLYVAEFNDLTTGESWWSVYRSMSLKDSHRTYRPALELLGNRQPIAIEEVKDRDMIFGRAEYIVYHDGRTSACRR